MGEDRGTAMAASVARTARSFGVPPEGVELLSRAHALAMAPRVALLPDQRHPAYLHPGHTVLILLRDVEVRDPVVLASAAATESEDDALRVALDAIETALGRSVAELVGRVPLPGSERLVEDLVTADESLRLVALAERLDQLRHAHLRDADEAWRRAAHAEAEAVYLPIAERTHARLAQRYRHWCSAFGRRLSR